MSRELTDDELLARMEKSLRRMPTAQREIFLAVRVDDLSYAEIAERTRRNKDEVKDYFADALFRLMADTDRSTLRERWQRLRRSLGLKG